MKKIKAIEKILHEAMCVDRFHLLKETRKLKKRFTRHGKDENLEKALDSLLKRAKHSAHRRLRRIKAMPEIKYIPELPITDKKDEIVSAIKSHRVVIIAGETGSGKTTQIPKFCIEAGRGAAGCIGCTQPRRIAAINVSGRIAQELGEPLGATVGYKIRFDDKSSSDAVIKVMTDGILLAETQKDPFLNAYDTIIVDEAHERSLNIDFTLGILRQLIKKRRDLKLIITSATIDTEKFSQAFEDAPIIEVSGRMYPVELRYMPVQGYDDPEQDDQGYVEAAAEAVDKIHRESRYGDVLIFMPTEQDITEAIELIRGRGYPGVVILPLYARLSAGEQSKVFSRGPGRKIIVSTNVAETSLTIPGIRYVVDSGLARIPLYSPRTRTTALPVTPISRSSADQRKGRCGRVADGICIRLYDEDDYASRTLYTSPEILRSNLAEVILRMISLSLGDVASFPFIDSPAPKSIKDGFDTLIELGAIKPDKRSRCKKQYLLTPRGRIMAGIPVDPKLSRILIEAHERGCLEEIIIIASALSISDPRQRPQDKIQQADQKHAQFKDPSSDFITLLNIWKACENAEKSLKTRGKVRKFCKDNFLSFKRLREWSDIRRQITSVLKEHGIKQEKPTALNAGTKGLKSKEFDIGGPLYMELHKSLLTGYLANIAHKKEKNIFQAAKGQKAMIFPGSGLFNRAGSWIVASEFVETTQLFARTAANIDPEWLEPLAGDMCTFTWSSPHWEKKRGEVVAKEQVSLFGLIIVPERTVSYGRINPVEAGEIFIRSALVEGEVPRPFPFMQHNQSLIDGILKLEEKTRRRDILASEEDIYLFYQSRLEKDFYNLRTFAKYLKDKKDDGFLRMTLEDIQKNSPDEDILSQFPDAIQMGQGSFRLEYDFQPGTDRDGVTVKVPAVSAASADTEAVEWLVPGLFKEKVTALIKNLPKKHRVKLVPVSTTADIIAGEMIHQGRPLFSELSMFVKKRFNVDVPASAWSDEGLDEHLKMRLSIRDDSDKELAVSRDKNILKDYSDQKISRGKGFEQAKKSYERSDITSWDFGDVAYSIEIEAHGEPVGENKCAEKAGPPENHIKYQTTIKATSQEDIHISVFPGLSRDNGEVSLRLFKTSDTALKSHKTGVRRLYEICFEKDFNALRKDIRASRDLKKYASLFGGAESFGGALFDCITNHLFARDIRTKKEFYAHAEAMLPGLYKMGQSLIKEVIVLCREYENCLETLKQLSLKNRNRLPVLELLESLEKDIKAMVPENFLRVYNYDKIGDIHRYVAAIRIRAQRGTVDPVRDQKKSREVEIYSAKLSTMLDSLNTDSSKEKADAVEAFYWMIEEYKVSLFAQELKTPLKVSPKRLNAACKEISMMI